MCRIGQNRKQRKVKSIVIYLHVVWKIWKDLIVSDRENVTGSKKGSNKNMNRSNAEYKKYADSHAKPSPIVANCIKAFFIGGIICTLGQLLFLVYSGLGMAENNARALVSVSLIFLAVLLTGLDLFDNIAKVGGAGTLVPITGFANAVVSPAIDTKAEGWILGVGAKLFTIAGPVILYGTLASVIYGVVYYIVTLVMGMI